jgi:hypothetical protein
VEAIKVEENIRPAVRQLSDAVNNAFGELGFRSKWSLINTF